MLNITLGVFIFCFLLERIFTGWKLPKVHAWYSRVVMVNIAQLFVVVMAGFTWEQWLADKSLLHLSQHMNPWLGGFLAYFIATFVFYWWHRLRHESDFLWRHFHQIHHSPQRLEVITSFYKHPHEMIVNSILGSVIVYSILGLSMEAGAVYTLFTALGEFFYHTNVRTPRWIGYIFQRPEMHRIHHQYNYHRNNYGDFAIWDMLFGTFQNPKTWNGRCGFDTSKELNMKDMLLLKDVHKLEDACTQAEEKLANGDLIFIDIPKFLFRGIAKSTKSWASHVGVAFKNNDGQWMVRESKVPRAKEVSLQNFIGRSANFRFEIKRYEKGLNDKQLHLMKLKSLSMLKTPYTFGFNFDSNKLFCSKFAYLTYQAAGIEAGQIQTFAELQRANPERSTRFWQIWFLGSIPWDRRTITPANQLNDPKFVSGLSCRASFNQNELSWTIAKPY